MSNLPKTFFTCACGKKTSTTALARAAAKVCVNCRPDLDAAPAKKAAPAKAKASKAKALPRAKVEAAAPAPTIERVAGSLADARRQIGPNADFEGFRAQGFTVMYLYEEPADAPARSFSLSMAKRRLAAPQLRMKFAALHRQGKMVGTQVIEIPLDPAAPENVAAADVGNAPIPAPEAIEDAASVTPAPEVDASAVDIPAPTAESIPAAATSAVVPSKRKKVSAIDAAAFVLRASGVPMTAKEILDAILERKLWESPNGKTPDQTLYAAMLRESVNKGAASRFVKAERGKFAANPVSA